MLRPALAAMLWLPCIAAACGDDGGEPERLFLQQLGPEGVTFRWRGEAESVCLTIEDTQRSIAGMRDGSHWRARIEGLEPDTAYRYRVGASAEHTFRTAPEPGAAPDDGRVHVWIIGDSGTAGDTDEAGEPEHEGEAEAVRDGFLRYNHEHGGDEPVDLFVLLGDSAYPAGRDHEWQRAFFDVYPTLAASAMTVPTLGNHEMGFGLIDFCEFQALLPEAMRGACAAGPLRRPIGGASSASDPMAYDEDGDGVPSGDGPPYLSIFELPTGAESGGVASGTELYYAVDYGVLHVVSLDSQVSNRDDAKRARMARWLEADLQANTLPWTVVVFHHPPYSKGMNHDSDVEDAEISMREVFTELFERHGVDVVYSGHAHSYERSWQLRGHRGPSATFVAAQHAAMDATGAPSFGTEDAPYDASIAGTAGRTIYTVAGNSGHVTTPDRYPPCEGSARIACDPGDWLAHPAHRTFDPTLPDHASNGIARIGSVVLDATPSTLRSRFVDDAGRILDEFVIRRAAP